MTVTPDHGPVGTLVHLEGAGFRDPFWQSVDASCRTSCGYGVFLEGGFPGDCDLIATTAFTLAITPAGHLLAQFTVPAKGDCFQQARGLPVSPGWYKIGIGCHVCDVGVFRVTAG